MHHKRVLLLLTGIALLLTISLNISGCTGWTGNINEGKRYYTGYDSLQMTFLDDSPPLTFYYDINSVDNEIPISVEIKNTGASVAFGTLYIHGYDPHIMQVAGGSMASGNIIGIPGSGASSFTVSGAYIGIPYSGGVSRSGASWAVSAYGKTYNYGYGAFVNGQSNQFNGFTFAYDSSSYGTAMATNILTMFHNYGNFNSFFAMHGDTPENPGGDMNVLDFPTVIYYLPPSLDQFTQPILVTACYSYATHASAVVCIDPKPTSNSRKACRPATVSMGGGQGAPVAITSVEQHASSSKTVFTIHVSHSGSSTDEVYDLNSLYKCDPESGAVIKSTDKNIVYITSIKVSGQSIMPDCVPTSKVLRLDSSGNGEISCTYYYSKSILPTTSTAPTSAYEAPLEVELAYGYSKNIYREILIKRI